MKSNKEKETKGNQRRTEIQEIQKVKGILPQYPYEMKWMKSDVKCRMNLESKEITGSDKEKPFWDKHWLTLYGCLLPQKML